MRGRIWFILLMVISASGCDKPGHVEKVADSNHKKENAQPQKISSYREVYASSLISDAILSKLPYAPANLNEGVGIVNVVCDKSQPDSKTIENLLPYAYENTGLIIAIMDDIKNKKSDWTREGLCASYLFSLAQLPVNAWSSRKGQSRDEMLNFNETWITASYVTAEGFWSDNLKDLQKSELLSESKAKDMIRKFFYEKSPEYISSFLSNAKYTDTLRFTADLSGTAKGVSFTASDNYSFDGGVAGGVLYKNGIELYGRGYLNGERVKLKIADD